MWGSVASCCTHILGGACKVLCVPQVYWLLLAISQDNPKNRHAAEMRDRCERAALEGFWVRAQSYGAAAHDT